MFRFPKDKDLYNRWIKFINHVSLNSTIYSNSKVCSLHFRVKDFEPHLLKARLLPKSVPCMLSGKEVNFSLGEKNNPGKHQKIYF